MRAQHAHQTHNRIFIEITKLAHLGARHQQVYKYPFIEYRFPHHAYSFCPIRLSQPINLAYIRTHALYHFFTPWSLALLWLNQQSAFTSRSQHLAEILTQKIFGNPNTLDILCS